MSYKKLFPKTEMKTCDMLAAEGGLGVGCYVSDGKLNPALNLIIRLNTVMKDISCAGYFTGVKKNVLLCNSYVLASDGEMKKMMIRRVVAAEPSFVELHTDSVNVLNVVGDEYYGEVTDTGTSVTVSPFEANVCGCVLKNGRIFGIDRDNRHRIKWSGEGGIDDWKEGISGAGRTVAQYGLGEILNLVVFRDTVVAVREFGLTFFSAYGNPENFRLSNPDFRLPKIFKNTAAVADGKLMLYTEDGLYIYDGSVAKKSELSLADEISEPRYASVKEGTYYLIGQSKSLERGAVLVADEGEGYCYLLDFAAEALSVGDRVFAYADKYEYEVSSGGEYTFLSGVTDFGSDAKKVLKEIKISFEGEVKLEVSNGVISRIVRGVRGKFKPNMRGKSFKIAVSGTGKIYNITAVAEVVCGI